MTDEGLLSIAARISLVILLMEVLIAHVARIAEQIVSLLKTLRRQF